MPWAAIIGAVGALGSAAINKNRAGGASTGAGGSASAPFSDARSVQPSLMFDNSGWNVTFGDNAGITAPTTNNKSLSPTLSPEAGNSSMGVLPSVSAGLGSNWTTMAALFVVALIVIKKLKKG